MHPHLVVDHVSRSFKGKIAVDDVSLDVREGEFVSLLGPSGCGKTTLLRIMAGFELPTTGRVILDGTDITNLTPNRRPVNLVFQRVTLFPHLDVFDNVSFGLRLARVRRDEMVERVRRTLELVRLPGFENRDVTTLSGGEAQRVALARAIVNEPKVLLLDEPLAALDLQIRRQVQIELKEIHRTLGTTFVYVTHDQEEALRMSDRVILMKDGRLVQSGTPVEIYRNPTSAFAASFVGTSNLLHGIVAGQNAEGSIVRSGGFLLKAAADLRTNEGDEVWVLLRPEALVIHHAANHTGEAGRSLAGVVIDVSFLGPTVTYRVSMTDGTILQVDRPLTDAVLQPADEVVVEWQPRDAAILVS